MRDEREREKAKTEIRGFTRCALGLRAHAARAGREWREKRKAKMGNRGFMRCALGSQGSRGACGTREKNKGQNGKSGLHEVRGAGSQGSRDVCGTKEREKNCHSVVLPCLVRGAVGFFSPRGFFEGKKHERRKKWRIGASIPVPPVC